MRGHTYVSVVEGRPTLGLEKADTETKQMRKARIVVARIMMKVEFVKYWNGVIQ